MVPLGRKGICDSGSSWVSDLGCIGYKAYESKFVKSHGLNDSLLILHRQHSSHRNEIASGATSLPKVFIGGNCIGGCAELSDLVSSGELEGLLKKAKALKTKK